MLLVCRISNNLKYCGYVLAVKQVDLLARTRTTTFILYRLYTRAVVMIKNLKVLLRLQYILLLLEHRYCRNVRFAMRYYM